MTDIKVKQIEWTEQLPPNRDWSYDHTLGSHPLGDFNITWKSWKEHPSFDLEGPDLDDGSCGWLGSFDSVEEAKEEAQFWVTSLVLTCLE